MDRIRVPSRLNYLMREGRVVKTNITSELGVYGVTVAYVHRHTVSAFSSTDSTCVFQ
jgi:hypothetical protein